MSLADSLRNVSETVLNYEAIIVSVSSANGYKLVDATKASSIPYSLAILDGGTAGTPFSGTGTASVLTVSAGSAGGYQSGSRELQFSATADGVAGATLAGLHSDRLTFTVSVTGN